jgi:hypothetical protein
MRVLLRRIGVVLVVALIWGVLAGAITAWWSFLLATDGEFVVMVVLATAPVAGLIGGLVYFVWTL